MIPPHKTSACPMLLVFPLAPPRRGVASANRRSHRRLRCSLQHTGEVSARIPARCRASGSGREQQPCQPRRAAFVMPLGNERGRLDGRARHGCLGRLCGASAGGAQTAALSGGSDRLTSVSRCGFGCAQSPTLVSASSITGTRNAAPASTTPPTVALTPTRACTDPLVPSIQQTSAASARM